MLEPAVHHGKDTTHKTLQTIGNAHVWQTQQCCKSCANGYKIVVLRFGDHRTKEMLGVVGSNFAQQLPMTYNNMQQDVQTDAKCDI